MQRTWRRLLRGPKHGIARGTGLYGGPDFKHDPAQITAALSSCERLSVWAQADQVDLMMIRPPSLRSTGLSISGGNPGWKRGRPVSGHGDSPESAARPMAHLAERASGRAAILRPDVRCCSTGESACTLRRAAPGGPICGCGPRSHTLTASEAAGTRTDVRRDPSGANPHRPGRVGKSYQIGQVRDIRGIGIVCASLCLAYAKVRTRTATSESGLENR